MSKLKTFQCSTNQLQKQCHKKHRYRVEKIAAADGVIISTPEYDHSCPAVLMNALAWLSYGIYPLLNKPVMITGLKHRFSTHSHMPNLKRAKARVLILSDEFVSHAYKHSTKKVT